ncbi:hypothetical protein BOW53_05790 [Solemya pervernicosa gill symbiont]|uniref:FAD dependent oxidoreductase domain-containing protein n=2 Tax=Gammaproteobacteria incertae sedis TaxID=118884 RepID=A0A1T2L7M5_9GAMM|nr:hypothetical protein BOW53_05790 [Solemya pervernicosa gill symbiont]
MNFDLIIVGQGLAGSLLAWRLLQRGVSVLVVDNGHRNASSRAAAGLINPVTGMRLVKTRGVEQLLPAALDCYAELEQQFGVKLYHAKPMLRLFASEREVEAWQKRYADPDYASWLGERLTSAELPAGIKGPLGGYIQPQSGYLDTNLLMCTLRHWLQQQGAWLESEIDYAEIEPHTDGVCWRDVSAQRLVFCEGYRVMDNPWFGWLPLQPAKGEILTLKPDRQPFELMVNAGKWLIPLHDGNWRLGASYDREHFDEETSEEERERLLASLNELLIDPHELELISHRAGVRSGTRDKMPLMGVHPEQSPLFSFNGFGSKGSLLIPWHGERMADYLLEGRPLPDTVDIARYQTLCH